MFFADVDVSFKHVLCLVMCHTPDMYSSNTKHSKFLGTQHPWDTAIGQQLCMTNCHRQLTMIARYATLTFGLLCCAGSQQQSPVPPSVRSSVSATSQVVPPSLLAPLIKLQQSFVLADPRQPDCPIVHASTAFLLMTGYPR